LNSFNIFLIIAITISLWLLHRTAAGNAINRRTTSKVFLILLFFGWLGATRLSFLQFPTFYQNFSLDTRGHLTWFGAVLGGFLALFIYLKRIKKPIKKILDLTTPSVSLAYGIGRIGCFTSEDGCFGIPCNPELNIIFCYETSRGHYLNTPIIESSISIVTFLILCFTPFKLRASTFFILHGITRFIIEFYRVNPLVYLNLTFSQIFSVFLIFAGIILYFQKD
jgi:phosphatidylglycerol---prolipoprotein diacylglyceryl transferase